jgi:hypothetical protein
MSSILSDAYSNERARRSGATSTSSDAKAQHAGFIGIDKRAVGQIMEPDSDESEKKVASLANALTGAAKADVQPQPTVSDQRKCETCGALETFWQTSEEDAETDGSDNEEDEPSTRELLEGDDDGSDFEDRKAAAVKAAVQRVRDEEKSKQANPLADAMRELSKNRR